MLFIIKDFRKAEDIYKTMYIPKSEEEKDIYETPTLRKKNYHVTSYLNNDYDIYDTNYKFESSWLS